MSNKISSPFIFFLTFLLSCHSVHIKASTQTKQSSALSGGGATVFSSSRNAFSLPSANMPLLQKLDFNVGNSFFRNPWVIAPASTDARDGLGPLMNTNGCQNCHIKDGRGHTPQSLEDNAVSLLVRLSIPSENGSIPEPNYGDQLQDFAIPGVKPEGRIQIYYTNKSVIFADGEKVMLRQPRLSIVDLAYGELHPQTQFSVRVAPPMIGLGLLEAIPAENILKNADPDDNNRDDISGKVNQVWDITKNAEAIGRFGWKAGQPTVRQQNAAAFNGDLGITSTLFPLDHCTSTQSACLHAPSGGSPELSENILNIVTLYARNLAVPARRNINDPQVMVGETLFSEIGCADCHMASWKTASDYELPWLANQTIYPYTDLLLHDMGEGLADNRPEAKANGREWRTPPLWGIGLTKVVSGETHLLHDGRARNITEAILWHSGEAEKSQKNFVQLTKDRRDAVVNFLNSL
ncbi:MAG: CxxC motif-containing protein (DUF1111 family) [Cellvibrionaceae bacterium]|jgi:CxxC motif-containing protein (DUF1111 family)